MKIGTLIKGALLALAAALSLPAHAQVIKPGTGGGGSVAVDATTAGALQQKLLVFSPWQGYGATRGDCTTDNTSAMTAPANAAASAGGILDMRGSCLKFTSTFNPPAGIKQWLMDYTYANRLIWGGSQSVSPIEITNPNIYVDGILLDGQRPTGDVRTDTAVTKAAIGFGVHGSMTTDSASYMAGFKFGRLGYINGEASNAFMFVNIAGLEGDQLSVNGNWGAAVGMAGIKGGRVKAIYTSDIGNLGPQTGRSGQSLAIFAEADPQKKPASWYNIAATGSTLATSQPCRNVLPLDDVWIGTLNTYGNFDTNAYLHDYGPDDTASAGGRPATCSGSGTAVGYGTGIGNISIDNIYAPVQGKDCFKQRRWVRGVRVGNLRCRYNGNRIASVEVWSGDTFIGNIDGDVVGADVVATVLGDGQNHLYTNNQVSGTATYNGTNETLSTSAYGVSLIQNASRVTIAGGYIRNVLGVSYAPTSQGYCVIADSSQDISVTLNCDTTAGSALRVNNVQRFYFDISSKDACRAQSGNTCYAFYFNPDTADSSNGTLRWRAWDTAGANLIAAPVRLNGSPSNITLIGNASPADFTRSGFNGDMVIVSATATNIQSTPLWQTSQTLTSQTTDANGRLTYSWTPHSTPVIDSAYVVGGAYALVPYSISQTSVTFQTSPSAASTNVGTVMFSAHVQNANGF